MLAMILVPLLVQNLQDLEEAQATLSGDTPSNTGGDGFIAGDYCGFVMGVGPSYGPAAGTGAVKFDTVADDNQGCVDESQFFYSSTSRESYARYARTVGATTTNYIMDFDFSSARYVALELEPGGDTWVWTGEAVFASASIPLGQRLVDFEWTCADVDVCSSGYDPADYYVRTNTTTGAVGGYAWSDYFNTFIDFGDISSPTITQELPPRYIETVVSILANETIDGPDDVDYTDAPLADGAEYWRIRVQFFDQTTLEPLDADDITSLTIVPTVTSDSRVYMNQVENTGNAVETSYMNPYMEIVDTTVDCTNTYETDFTEGCILYEDLDGSTSFNKFIYSGAPTSNVLGFNDDTDMALEYPSDRDGCRWIYLSQWEEVDEAARSACPPAPAYDNKADVFHERETARNKYEIDYVTVTVAFAWESIDLEMYTYGTAGDGSVAFVTSGVAGNAWSHYFADGTSDLSYRPRYQINKFVAVYDSEEHTTISENTSKAMSLNTEAVTSNTSDAFQLGHSGAAKPSYNVNYQMDATSATDDPVSGDIYLLIDTDNPPNAPASRDVEETYRTDNLVASNPSYSNYEKNYAIGYGQKASECSSTAPLGSDHPCAASTNTPLTDPTAEQWVCDDATETTMGDTSCYYTEYLPHLDRHINPAESMFVIGAINSIIDADDVLEEISESEGTILSTLGTTETINLRNKMYAWVLRYTLGQDASSGPVELMTGRLVFAEGDVTLDSFDGSDKTLVVLGGDVYINTDIEDGRMGIIAFQRGGVGGNVYVDNEVTDLWVNFFLDGSLFSYDDDNAALLASGDVPDYGGSDELRYETLANQLYLKGSLVSHNTVNGVEDSDGDGSYDLGDGTTTSDSEVAREYDLNMLRQYRLCWPLVDGVPDETGTPEVCGGGEVLSSYLDGDGYEVYNSFIIEYSPAEGLPIFSVESGLFN